MNGYAYFFLLLVIRIGFVPVVYTVGEESGPVNITVSIVDNILSRGQILELSVFTQDISATGKSCCAPLSITTRTNPVVFTPCVTISH